MNWADFLPMEWRDWLEVFILWFGIYYAWRSIRGTRGARVLTGLALLILFIATLAGFFNLPVLGWMFRNITTAFIFTLIVIFQPEVRRGLAAIGSNKLFTSASGSHSSPRRLSTSRTASSARSSPSSAIKISSRSARAGRRSTASFPPR